MKRQLMIVCFFALLFARSAFASCVNPANPIEAENCNPGASGWQISDSGDPTLQGFATSISVALGQTISFKINTTARSYNITIFRMGYYGGLGARQVATVSPSVALPQTQPACLTDAATKLYDCGNWAVSASWTVPTTAVSGIYFAVLNRPDTGGASHIFFVVRNDASHSDILFQTSDETWQAYNIYGGHSLYGDTGWNLPARAFKVSYNRPFNTATLETATWLFNAEYPMVRWLEANGYDVSYFSSVDAATSGGLILNHKAYLSVGHDEYWSGQKRASIEAARAAGVNLAFFSGNEAFWKTRWENSIDGSNTPYRTLVCYKETLAGVKIDPAGPATWTGTWRDPTFSPPGDGGRPENAITGTLFMVNGPGSDNTNLSIKVPAADGQMRFWRNTPQVSRQAAGTTYTLPAGTLGYEWDVDADNGFRPAGLFDLSSATYPLTDDYLLDYGGVYGAGTATHRLTMYRYHKDLGLPSQTPLGLVFGAGTVQWSWGLDANHDNGFGTVTDVNMQQATVNLFADMGIQPATLRSGLLPALISFDTAPPASTITAPVDGASLQYGAQVTVSGTATDLGGGLVAGVEVSLDGGSNWRPATGRDNWTYTSSLLSTGTVTILSRAVDDSGNIELPRGVTVNVPVPPIVTDVQVFGDNPAPSNTVSTPPFSTNSANELLLAFIGTDYLSALNTSVTGVSGGGLTWTLVLRTNVKPGTSEIWRAFSSASLSNATVTATLSQGVSSSITVMSFTGIDTSGVNGAGAIGATASKNAATGAPQASVVTTRVNSVVLGVGNDFDRAISRVPSVGQTIVHQYLSPVGDTYWVQRLNIPSLQSGATAIISDTAPTSDEYNLSLVEVLPAATGAFSISGTLTPAAVGSSATVSLSGPVNATVNADASGNFSFASLPNGSYVVTPSKSGIVFTPANRTIVVNGSSVSGVGFAGAQTYAISGAISPATFGSGTLLTLSGGATGTTTADASGNFTFSGIASGSYTVTPSKAGFSFTPAFQTVTVNGGSVSGVSFTAAQLTYSLSGSVTATGANASVMLGGPSSATTTADASGGFTFTGLVNGSYTVTPTKAGVTFSPTSQSAIVSGASVAGVNFTAVATYGLSGTLTATGANASVALSGTATRTTIADASGNYSFGGLINGSYTVTPTKSGVAFSPASQAVTVSGANATADFTAVLAATFNLSGTLTATGANASVALSGASTATTTADASGNYSFAGLLNGSYTVTPTKSGVAFSPASQAVTVNGANTTANFTASIATGIATDAIVFRDGAAASNTIATPAFSTTTGNELLLAFISADYLSGTNTTVTSIAGGGLAWTLVVRANAQSGTAEIWRAFSPATLSNVAITATLSQSVISSITVMSFTGVDTTGTNGANAIGAIKSASAKSGAPTASLVTTRNGSLILGVGTDYDNATARTVGAAQTLVHQYFSPAGDTYWVQRRSAVTPTAGTTVTINDTAPTADRYNLGIVEVRTP